jgi:hypothetical protein
MKVDLMLPKKLKECGTNEGYLDILSIGK